MKTFFSIIVLIALTGFYHRPDVASLACLTKEEKKLYDLIMEYRRSKNLEPIPLSESLTLVAQTHAKDLSENYKFDPGNRCNPHSWS